MSKDKVVCDESVQAALKAFRNESDERFIVLGYSQPNTLVVIAEGPGGLQAAGEHLVDDDARYVLLRKVHQVEVASTIKFAFVDWTPDSVKPLRKALLSTHKGQVQEMLKPYHVSLQATTRSELNEDEIAHKISDSSGTSSHVTESKVQSRPASKSVASFTPAAAREESLHFENEDDVKSALKEVRDDHSETNWALVGYKDVKTLALFGKGSGGVDELAGKLDDDQVFYALFRVTETVDQSTTVKFCFLRLLSDQVRPTDRAKMSTHMGFVHKLFEPFHLEFSLDTRSDFKLEYVTQKIRDNMFLDSRVRDAGDQKTRPVRASVAHKGPSVNQGGAGLTLANEEELKKAIAEVRNRESDKKWVTLSYTAKNTLSLLGTGTGGIDEMVATFEESNNNFGLLRVIEQIDKSMTVKFVYFKWQPDSVPPMQKAQLSVLSGTISALFEPFHVDFFISNKSDISQQIVMDRVTSISGSKSHIVNA